MLVYCMCRFPLFGLLFCLADGVISSLHLFFSNTSLVQKKKKTAPLLISTVQLEFKSKGLFSLDEEEGGAVVEPSQRDQDRPKRQR